MCYYMSKYTKLQNKSVYINPGSFKSYGGWSIDTKFYTTIKSEYLLAHGIGTTVKDAVTETMLPTPRKYRIWIKTKN